MKQSFVFESGAKCIISLESLVFLVPKTNETQASTSLKSSSSHFELFELDVRAAASNSSSSALTNLNILTMKTSGIYLNCGLIPPSLLFDSSCTLKRGFSFKYCQRSLEQHIVCKYIMSVAEQNNTAIYQLEAPTLNQLNHKYLSQALCSTGETTSAPYTVVSLTFVIRKNSLLPLISCKNEHTSCGSG